MPYATNLQRRGAVYYWRRRVPLGFAATPDSTPDRSWVKLSLRTRDPIRARYLAAQLDATAAELFMTTAPETITQEQLAQLFQDAFATHAAKLDRVAAFARREPGFDPASEMAAERAMGWSYRVASAKGPHARLADDDRAAMQRAGLDGIEIDGVGAYLDAMRETGQLKPSSARVRDHVEGVGALPSPGNVAQAEPIYLRALGEALLRTRTRYAADPLPYDDLIDALLGQPRQAAPTVEIAVPVSAGIVRPPSPPPGAPAGPGATPPVSAPDPAATVEAVGAKLIAEKRQDGDWDDKTCRQADFIFGLFGRFLREEHGVTDLSALRQAHCDAFDGFLRVLSKNIGKSPQDRHRSIRELRRIGATKAPAERGLAGSTRNRHLTFLGQALARARRTGVAIDGGVVLADFRVKKKKRGRDDRPTPPSAALDGFFLSPIFTGCRAWNVVHQAGPELFHRAAYYGPMLAHYTGMRREEFCALAVEDIVTSHGEHPYIHVCNNAFGRVKNAQSVRNIALHPELIRLGFLDYVAELRRVGHARVFPDLYSKTNKGLLGDRLYDELLPAFKKAGFTTHQVRHYFGNALKQQRVPAEFRADMLGHGGKTETTERYCDPIGIALRLEELAKLPNPTAHLQPKPIHLVPWVERKQIAPWSYAYRRRHSSKGTKI